VGHVKKTGHEQWLILTPAEGLKYMQESARPEREKNTKWKLESENETDWSAWKFNTWRESCHEKASSEGEENSVSGSPSVEGENEDMDADVVERFEEVSRELSDEYIDKGFEEEDSSEPRPMKRPRRR
jgi:hypothetical protein